MSETGDVSAAKPSALAPIIVMSFNRPDYLRQVLTSLMAQEGAEIGQRRIYLFQDGHRNKFSGRAHTSAQPIADSIAAFRDIVPTGYLMASSYNLGVALNFDRAERFAFEELQAFAAIFLEDDMVLSPHYIATMDALLAAHADDPRIGYVAAYGDHAVPLDEQMQAPGRLVAMHHNWAFGLYRRQWLRMRPFIEQYLALVSDIDYRRRDHEAIWSLYERWGFGRQPSSQDAAKTMACLLADTIKIKTRACLGRYIGERGIHMSPTVFEQRGFSRVELYPEAITTFEPVDAALVERVGGELRRWAGRPVPATA